LLKVACRWPGRDSHSQRESYEYDTLPTRPLAPTEAHCCEQLAQSCYSTMRRPGVEPVTSRSQVQRPTTTLPSHPISVNIITLIIGLLFNSICYVCICLLIYNTEQLLISSRLLVTCWTDQMPSRPNRRVKCRCDSAHHWPLLAAFLCSGR